MKSFSEIQRRHADPAEFPVDDVALKAEKPSGFASLVRMIGVEPIGFGKRISANGTAVALERQQFLNEFSRESKSLPSPVTRTVATKEWIGFVTFFHTFLCACFGVLRLRVRASAQDAIGARVNLTAVVLAFLASVVAAVACVLSFSAFGSQVFDAPQLQYLLAIFPVVLALVLTVSPPLLRCTFVLLHGGSLSHRLSPNMPRTIREGWF